MRDITKEMMSYEELQLLWENLLDNPSTMEFSMFEYVDIDNEENDAVVSEVNFLDDTPLFQGKGIVDIFMTKKVNVENPTWRDVANIFNDNNDGSHIFMETCEVEGNSINIFAGS